MASLTRGACLALALAAGQARAVAGQAAGGGILERLKIDRLQLVSLGASAGPILPSQVASTTVYGVGADYGEIARAWRLVFGVSYWQSRYTDAVIQAFADNLTANIVNGSAATRVVPSPVSVYDVTFSTEFRWMRPSAAALRPFLGVGAAAHVINAEGTLIRGTFVERSLDDIATGVFGSAGLQLRVVNHFGLEGLVRGDLLSGIRSAQARAAVNYYFGHIRSVTR